MNGQETGLSTVGGAHPERRPCRHRGRWLVLVRHPETRKNVIQGFGGGAADDEPTARGREDLDQLVGSLATVAARRGQCCDVSVWSSGAPRTLAAAEMLATAIGVDCFPDDRLGPIGNGVLGGRTAEQVAEEFPDYFRSLQLHRRGLVSSYCLEHVGEPITSFEARVVEILSRIEEEGSSISFVFSHKSTIGASLIFFARRFCSYPSDFYGYVEIPVGSVSIVSPMGGQLLLAGGNLTTASDLIEFPALGLDPLRWPTEL